ncbi:MAG: MFS transporter [Bryobacteraceae bacterium]|nr:MFS transporter [Bryobacterales bacterium]MEB2361774.1 MFS transporter [Bryobacterales bacterium]NUN01697.1 MFS transporter [Bryobacteraceae bacterium]
MKIPKMRWVIAAMLCMATMINYADRLTLAVVSVEVRNEFGMTEQDYSYILALFMLAYAIMYAGSGYIVDRLGTRRGFAVFIFSWSLAQMMHAFTRGKTSLGAARFALGLTEPGNWPAAAKAIAEWFPASQRALGVGIFNAGSSLGSAIAPPMVAVITLHYGWRASFIFTASLGFVWLSFWLLLYNPPHRNRWLRQSEYEAMKDHIRPPEETLPADSNTLNWRRVIGMRQCYTLILTRFFTDPVIYFVIFWLPEYLRRERGFDLALVGKYAWVPFIFGDLGYVLGGWLSGRLIRSGWSLPRARKFVMLLGASVMPAAMLAPFVSEAWMAIAAICFVTFGHAFWVANLQTLPTDLFRATEVGTATGFSGMGGAIGGVLAQLGTGYIVTHFSYAPIFLLAGIFHPLSAALTYWLLPDRYFKQRA